MTGHWADGLPGLAVAITYLLALAGAAGLTARGHRPTRTDQRKAGR